MAFLSAPEMLWLYSGVTNTYASNEAIFEAHTFVCAWLYWPRLGGAGSSSKGRRYSAMSTNSNSASRRPLAILNTQRATASLLRRGRVLPVTIAALIMFHHLISRGRKDLSSNGAAS